MPIDIVSISHIKYQNCVWNCLVAWSMWKKGVKILSRSSQWWLSRFECKLLCFSPYMRKPVLFLLHHIEAEVKQRGPLCYSTTSVQWQSSTRKKNLNQTHSSSSEASAWLTQKEKIFFQNFGQLEGLGWAAKKAPRFRLVQCLSVCQIDFTALMKSKQRAWLTALCHKFSKVKSLSQASKYNTFLPASKWPFYFISLRNFTRHITT